MQGETMKFSLQMFERTEHRFRWELHWIRNLRISQHL